MLKDFSAIRQLAISQRLVDVKSHFRFRNQNSFNKSRFPEFNEGDEITRKMF